VGDIGFVIKCLNTVRRLTANSAVVFVSRNMQFISSFCTRVIVMQHGATLLDSPNPAEGIDRYYALVKFEQQTFGTGEAEVLGLDLVVDGETLMDAEPKVKRGSRPTALLRIKVRGPRHGVHVLINVLDQAMSPVISTPIRETEAKMLCVPPGESRLEIPLWEIDLNSGKYSFVVSIKDADTSITLARAQGLRPFIISIEETYWGKIVRPAIVRSELLATTIDEFRK